MSGLMKFVGFMELLSQAFNVVYQGVSLALESAWEELPSRETVVEKADQLKTYVQSFRHLKSPAKLNHPAIHQFKRDLRQGVRDLHSTRETFQGSEEIQKIFRSVAELSGPLIIHEAAGAGLDLIGLSSLAYLVRLRGRIGFSVRGLVLLALVPPYFSKAEKQEKRRQDSDAVIVDPETRQMSEVQDRALRDFLNLNILHVFALMWAVKQVPEIGALKFFANAYMKGHFLWQYPLARDQWTAASVIARLASRPDAILMLGGVSELGWQTLNYCLPVVAALPTQLLWNLGLVLLSYHLHGPFSVDLKDRASSPKGYDPGYLLWKGNNLLIDLLSRTPTEPPAAIWGRRVGTVLDVTGLRGLKVSDVERFFNHSSVKIVRKALGVEALSSLMTRSTADIFNEYSTSLIDANNFIRDHEVGLSRSKTIAVSRIFQYAGRPLLLWVYGKKGTIASIIVASDFVLNAFPGITPKKLTEWLRTAAESLDRPVATVFKSAEIKEVLQKNDKDTVSMVGVGKPVTPMRMTIHAESSSSVRLPEGVVEGEFCQRR